MTPLAYSSHHLSTRVPRRIQVQICGDAHLSNFGSLASPERQQVFEITTDPRCHQLGAPEQLGPGRQLSRAK